MSLVMPVQMVSSPALYNGIVVGEGLALLSRNGNFRIARQEQAPTDCNPACESCPMDITDPDIILTFCMPVRKIGEVMKTIIGKVMLTLSFLFLAVVPALFVWWGLEGELNLFYLLAAVASSGLFLALYRIIDILEQW
jgi:hypothetical protein